MILGPWFDYGIGWGLGTLAWFSILAAFAFESRRYAKRLAYLQILAGLVVAATEFLGLLLLQAPIGMAASTVLADPTILSIWLPPAGHGAFALLLALRWQDLEEANDDRMTCRRCGYSLFSLVSGICPECGTSVAGGTSIIPSPAVIHTSIGSVVSIALHAISGIAAVLLLRRAQNWLTLINGGVILIWCVAVLANALMKWVPGRGPELPQRHMDTRTAISARAGGRAFEKPKYHTDPHWRCFFCYLYGPAIMTYALLLLNSHETWTGLGCGIILAGLVVKAVASITRMA